jgi:hypothetical protein
LVIFKNDYFSEETINEVRKQAAGDVQKAVFAAEQKANETIKREREGLEKMLQNAQHKLVEDEIYNNKQEDNAQTV